MRSPLSSFFGAGLFRKQDSSGEFTVAKNKNKNMFRGERKSTNGTCTRPTTIGGHF